MRRSLPLVLLAALLAAPAGAQAPAPPTTGERVLLAPPTAPVGSVAAGDAVVLDASPVVPRGAPALWKGGLVGELVGVASGVGLFLLIDGVDGSAGRYASALPALGLPVGAAVGVVVHGRRRGVDGSVSGAFAGSAVGLVPPLALGGLTVLAVRNDLGDGLDVAAALGTVAVLAVVALPTLAASAGYRRGAGPGGPAERRVAVAPAAFRAPTGETGPGLTLRVGL